ncbi:MAG: hypothetical protein ABIR96_12480 [Bdellovibrionota bacterium]
MVFLVTASLAACSRNPEPPPPSSQHSACSKIALQSREWTPAITRDVLSCLLGKNPNASLRLQEAPPEQFQHLSRYLNEAFKDPAKRKELARILAITRQTSGVLGPLLREPLVLEIGSRKDFVPALPWLVSSLDAIREILVRRPEVLLDWVAEWNALNPRGELLRSLHPPVSELLAGISSEKRNSAALLGSARTLFADLAIQPQRLYTLDVLSRTQICDASDSSVLTLSPMAQTLDFFREDRRNPEHFLTSVQQGFGYWYRVCRPRGEALDQKIINASLSWLFENWEPLQDFFETPESRDLIRPGQRLIAIASRYANADRQDNALLVWLFAHEIPQTLVESLQRDPQKLRAWIHGFQDLAPLMQSLPDTSLKVSPEFLHLAEKDPSWGLWLEAVAHVPPEALQELWTLAQTLTPGGLKDLADGIESAEGQDLIRFMEWIVNVRGKFEAPTIETRVPPPVANEDSPVAEQLRNARRILSECLEQGNLSVAEKCLEAKGLPTPPAFVSELWKLHSDSAALKSAQDPDILLLSQPTLAKKFWNPLLNWVRDTSLPMRPTVDVIAQLGELVRRNPNHAWNASLDQAWTQLRATAAAPLTPSGAGMRFYRSERSEEINPDFFSDVELRNVLLDPAFFKKVLSWITVDRSSLPARRSLLKINGQRFDINFWTQEGRLEKVNVSSIEALDLLFWELQIPVISSPHMIRGVLESWDTLRSPDDVRAWLDAKDGLLGFGIGLAGLVNGPGEGLRRRLENAQAVVRGLRAHGEQHADLIRATAVLSLFKDSRGRFTDATVKSLMALHQFGFMHLLTTVFDPKSSWASRLESTDRLPISDRVIESLAIQLRRMLDRTPTQDLSALAASQLRQDLWILRAATASFMKIALEDPAALTLFDKENVAFSRLLDDAHSKVFLPWAQAQRGKQDSVRDSDLLRLKNIIFGLNATPKIAWLLLLTDLVKSPELDAFWPQISQLSRADVERLTRWLESGIPERLLRWNTLLQVQNPDANPR